MGSTVVAAILAAGAACGIGAGAALQQQAAYGTTGPGTRGIRLIAILLRRPVWLLGIAAMVVGFGLQAAALDLGRLAVVEPVLATSLVVAVVVAARRRRSWPRPADWLAMGFAAGGVALFLVVAAPAGGRSQPPALAWVPLLAGVALLGFGAIWRSRRWSPPRRAMALAAAAGITLGCSDALVKTTVAIVSAQHLAVLATFAPYVLVVVGGAGFVLQQHAYRIGELKAALPAASVLEPLTGTVLGLTIFSERIAVHDVGSGAVLLIAAAIAIAAVWRLGSAPLLAQGDAVGR